MGKLSPQTTEKTQVQQSSGTEKLLDKQNVQNCGNNNPIGAKFCNSCGSQLSPACIKCGYSNPNGAYFLDNVGRS